MSYSLISETKPKASKDYPCIWCQEKILKGEVYVHEISKYDGRLQNHHWHPECDAASVDFFTGTGEEEFDPHSFKRGSLEEA
jgi:hypothetical protein